ncbi:2'-5' RNA ligase family protein [Sandaracinobacteroides saxicola]|uniref:2'-5' RNA ligase family protein n=1 Tax=Sandaracinobacteroides saxicola TaxID=2759707 RepID=A0A7G5IEB1_9SPHN|nr:2'-5' RNA ligase family protein [Sandaracinobacteroides saxicola]QMW21703.1 2'-5' RNA ligase family protein [Sandaracinobacteroides saxicola]
MPEPPFAPLIVTLGFPAAVAARLEALRRAHYPPALNRVPAHLTLFHHLPGTEVAAVTATLREAARHLAAPEGWLAGVRFLGRGSAWVVESDGLLALRDWLAGRFADWLIPQDQAGFRPHVTLANKLPAAEAKRCHAVLQAELRPLPFRAESLLLWRFDGGPWTRLAAVAFRR